MRLLLAFCACATLYKRWAKPRAILVDSLKYPHDKKRREQGHTHRLPLHGHVFNPERREDGVQLRMGEMAAGREGLAPEAAPTMEMPRRRRVTRR